MKQAIIKPLISRSARGRTVIRSIRFRLALWFVLILGVVMVIFSAFVYTRQTAELRESTAGRLEYKAERMASVFRSASRDYFARGPWYIPNDPASGESFLQAGDVLALVEPGGSVVVSWGPPELSSVSLLAEQSLKAGNLDKSFRERIIPAELELNNSRASYLVAMIPIVHDYRIAGYFLIGSQVDPDQQLPRLLASLTLGVIGMLGLALIGGFWMADRAIKPVSRITEMAREISESDLSRRLQIKRKDELGELADTFDGMLERLQAAFERQRQFTSDASHELRTPLSIVELETGRALAAPRSNNEYERSLRVIRSENQFMIRLVNNLLMLARMDGGQIEVLKDELDLSDVTLEVIERLAPLSVKEGARLTAGELPELVIRGDRQQLVQMITNLVENGIKYTRGSDRQVRVETSMVEISGKKKGCLRIADNGPGIEPAHIPHVFERFYQIDPSRSHSSERENGGGLSEPEAENAISGHEDLASGAGLGLSIARWIARAHGGDIQILSRVGVGTVFEVILPLVEEI